MSEDIMGGTLPHVIEAGENDIFIVKISAVEDPKDPGRVVSFEASCLGAQGVLTSPAVSRRLGQSLVALGQDIVARSRGNAPSHGTWRGAAGE